MRTRRAAWLVSVCALLSCSAEEDKPVFCPATTSTSCPSNCTRLRAFRLRSDRRCFEPAAVVGCGRIGISGRVQPSCHIRLSDGVLFIFTMDWGSNAPVAPEWRRCTMPEWEAIPKVTCDGSDAAAEFE